MSNLLQYSFRLSLSICSICLPLSLVFLAGCPPVSSEDAGTLDSGNPLLDSGPVPFDGGQSDAGKDAGASFDGGQSDAGNDAGSFFDGGQSDAGKDAGTLFLDAGRDAGNTGFLDAGTPLDAGQASDAGAQYDAGSLTIDGGSVDAGPVEDALLPDPSTIIAPLSRSRPTTIGDVTSVLIDNGFQINLQPDILDDKRLTIVSGFVFFKGRPLPNVAVSVLGEDALGHTLTRADGKFDLVVNGGGLLNIVFEKENYLSSQRQVHTRWHLPVTTDDVYLIKRAPVLATLVLENGALALPTLVREVPFIGERGERAGALFFPSGVQAEAEFADGSSVPLESQLNIRITEYTRGNNGPQQMPAPLPAPSAYTYCVEIEIDEAEALGATGVKLNQLVPYYVENFLNFPVGNVVPVGRFVRSRGVWVAERDANILKIVGISDGKADLDLVGDGNIDTALYAEFGITDEERTSLAIT